MTANAAQSISKEAGFSRCRAKYIRQPDGSLKLACIQHFSLPIFNPLELESATAKREEDFFRIKPENLTEAQKEFFAKENARRSVRRAKVSCMDMILCNPELDTFATFTFSPEKVTSRADYNELYEVLRVWLSNRVTRRGLKYVITPEHHKDGENIHFHAIMNHEALQLAKARTWRSNNQCYNITDWKHGFSTAFIISGEDAQTKVAKYIFKYMGKQMGQKIGGKYYLHGGKMVSPVYLYGDTVAEFLNGEIATYQREIRVSENQVYTEVDFI